jgi:hypothetical protein
MHRITVSWPGGEGPVDFDRDPDECPQCHKGITPRRVTGALAADPEVSRALLETVYQCPRHECLALFIARYRRADRGRPGLMQPWGDFLLLHVAPWEPEKPPVPDGVEAISPLFVEIYSQASAAEHHGLGQVAGVGYRKALEFLVKDYCITLSPDASAEIEKERLAKVIEDRVSDENVKHCAKLATWLGNDETHYVRKWEDKDIRDLKALITLTVNWIHNSVLSAKYVAEMDTSEEDSGES